MLRWAAFAICIAVSAFGALRLVHRQTGGFPLTFAAAVLAVGIVAERSRYKPELDRPPGKPPGAGWQRTSETTVDEDGRIITVWFNPATGERAYVKSK